MAPHIWNFSLTGPLVEGLLIGLVFGLLAFVAIWAVAELAERVIHVLKGDDASDLDLNDLPNVFHKRHGTT